MHTDILDLREFYLGSLGLTVRHVLRARLRHIWPNIKGERILMLGFGTPLMRPFLEDAGSILAMMPSGQGATYWPREGPNLTSLVDMNHLPLPDDCVDRVVLIHAFEGVADTHGLLQEVHRVLKANGRMLLIVPNRHGLWAHSDRTPFGNGQPYSSTQVKAVLRDEGFLIDRTSRALYFPPTSSRLILSFAEYIEKYAGKILPGLGGLLLVEAGKQLYSPLLIKSASPRHRLVLPLPLPSPIPPVPAGRS